MLHGETVMLTDMLDCRERRARKQDEYRKKYHTTIISFCMNIPGPIKTNEDITKVFTVFFNTWKTIISQFWNL